QDAIEETKGDQRPKHTVTAQDGQGVGQGMSKETQQTPPAVEPEPTAHGIERIAGGIAGPRLHLGVLVGNEIAPLQFPLQQPCVQGSKVEQAGQQTQEPSRQPCCGCRPPEEKEEMASFTCRCG